MKFGFGINVGIKATIATSSGPLYQKWTTYADSPVLTSLYPYQWICNNDTRYLLASTGKLYVSGGSAQSVGTSKRYRWDTDHWTYLADHAPDSAMVGGVYGGQIQCNYDVYTSNALTAVYFAKTTP